MANVTSGADLASQVGAFLRGRRHPASSLAIASRFLRAAVPSEQLATRLLRPVLEPAGMVYEEAAGWSAPAAPELPGTEAERRLVAVVVDRAGDRIETAGMDDEPVRDLTEATAVMMSPSRDATSLREWLVRHGRPVPAAIVSFRTMLRGSGRVPRDATLERICALLGVHWLDSGTAEGEARAMAACLAAAAERRTARPEVTSPELPEGLPPGGLGELPAEPGIYRFYDEAGDLLYVGKAADLRRRLSSYFAPGRRREGHGSRFLPSARRLEYETVRSDLEALLAEARLIERRSPRANVQRTVRERGRSYRGSRAFALLFGRGSTGSVTVVFVRDGRYLGTARLGPRGGGKLRVHGLLARAIGTAAGRIGRKADRDSAILTSWLAHHGELVDRIDLDGFATLEDASRALFSAVREPDDAADPFVFR